MARLTYKNKNGTWGLNNGYDMHKVPKELYGVLWKLKDYYKRVAAGPEKTPHQRRQGTIKNQCRKTNRKHKRTAGKPIEQVQAMLGHESIDTTLIYARTNDSTVKESHKRYLT
ncbi:MAG: hypothetical protein K2M46_06130 [Lachnospiraceae bacterium]|nr:hypothetical protein [Lachnospiraceae bacterium]